MQFIAALTLGLLIGGVAGMWLTLRLLASYIARNYVVRTSTDSHKR